MKIILQKERDADKSTYYFSGCGLIFNFFEDIIFLQKWLILKSV